MQDISLPQESDLATGYQPLHLWPDNETADWATWLDKSNSIIIDAKQYQGICSEHMLWTHDISTPDGAHIMLTKYMYIISTLEAMAFLWMSSMT